MIGPPTMELAAIPATIKMTPHRGDSALRKVRRRPHGQVGSEGSKVALAQLARLCDDEKCDRKFPGGAGAVSCPERRYVAYDWTD
jgi:hypothetical protein